MVPWGVGVVILQIIPSKTTLLLLPHMTTTGENVRGTSAVSLIATAAFGLEALVGREVKALGYPSKTIQPGRLLIEADLAAICRLNIELRTAERVMICVGRFAADDFGMPV